ncbi:uncharacterized protein [Panulirus ornatus]|uniref:uncharacterized protein n=1 Tax=Panulirus ornatus TaxID=150431 RepID=UPI003A8961B3
MSLQPVVTSLTSVSSALGYVRMSPAASEGWTPARGSPSSANEFTHPPMSPKAASFTIRALLGLDSCKERRRSKASPYPTSPASDRCNRQVSLTTVSSSTLSSSTPVHNIPATTHRDIPGPSHQQDLPSTTHQDIPGPNHQQDLPSTTHRDIPGPSHHQDLLSTTYQNIPGPNHQQDLPSTPHQDIPGPTHHQDLPSTTHRDIPGPSHHQDLPSTTHRDIRGPSHHQDLPSTTRQDIPGPTHHQDLPSTPHQDIPGPNHHQDLPSTTRQDIPGPNHHQDLPSTTHQDTFSTRQKDVPVRVKRVRTTFTGAQLHRLEEEFERQQYLVGPKRRYLAAQLDLTEVQLKVWFQNRRIKWRKNHTIEDENP